MCKESYNAIMLIGKDMAVQAALGDIETNVSVDQRYGDIIGISIGESYTRTELGQVNLSLKASSRDITINVPLTQFIPDGERQMWPCKISAGTVVNAKLTLRLATLSAAKPIPLIFHLADPNSCE